jgi:hypothetical protein
MEREWVIVVLTLNEYFFSCIMARSKYQLYYVWFDLTGARTHDLPLESNTITITPSMLSNGKKGVKW